MSRAADKGGQLDLLFWAQALGGLINFNQRGQGNTIQSMKPWKVIVLRGMMIMIFFCTRPNNYLLSITVWSHLVLFSKFLWTKSSHLGQKISQLQILQQFQVGPINFDQMKAAWFERDFCVNYASYLAKLLTFFRQNVTDVTTTANRLVVLHRQQHKQSCTSKIKRF